MSNITDLKPQNISGLFKEPITNVLDAHDNRKCPECGGWCWMLHGMSACGLEADYPACEDCDWTGEPK